MTMPAMLCPLSTSDKLESSDLTGRPVVSRPGCSGGWQRSEALGRYGASPSGPIPGM